MSFMDLFRRDPVKKLAEFEADATIKRKTETARELAKVENLAAPRIAFAEPGLVREGHAYILVPDPEDGDAEPAPDRDKARVGKLVEKLNAGGLARGRVLSKWPKGYARREPRSIAAKKG